jgi:hypothetical protein
MFSPRPATGKPASCRAARPCQKNFQKYFFIFALKKEVGALLWQNGNEITFRETELAFLIRLFTGYLQLYPTHTQNFCLLCSACATPRGRVLF